MASGSCSRAKRLLRCFCGCTELTEEEVKRIYRLSAQETLINQQASQIFRKFLQNERSGDKSEAEQFLDIYELSENFISEKKVLDTDELEVLVDAGLQYQQEKELKKEIRTGDHYKIEMCLRRIQGNCRNEIEASQEYKNYKQAILDKLKNLPKK